MKKEIRKRLLKERRALSQAEVKTKSKEIVKNLLSLPEFIEAGTILLYASFDNEAETCWLLETCFEKKTVIMPKMENGELALYKITSGSNLIKNKYGIFEPPKNSEKISDFEKIDLAIIPGIAFDRSGNRVGYGKGYYDRLLPMLRCQKIGLAYDFQVVDSIPEEAHDVKVDILISEKSVFRFSKIIDGKKISWPILQKVKEDVSLLGKKPSLAAILIGDNEASKTYISIKKKRCEELGIIFNAHFFDNNVREEEVISLISMLNKDDKTSAILVQVPLPGHLSKERILNAILPEKDADSLTFQNFGKLFYGSWELMPCTPKGIIKAIESTGQRIEGKHAVIVGRGNIVGKPLSLMLLQKNATVTVCHSKTKNLKDITKKADILVAAAGCPGLIKKDMVKKGAIVIDVGITKKSGKLYGDAEFDELKKECSFITPVPGGIGPMTVAMLMENILICHKKQVTKD